MVTCSWLTLLVMICSYTPLHGMLRRAGCRAIARPAMVLRALTRQKTAFRTQPLQRQPVVNFSSNLAQNVLNLTTKLKGSFHETQLRKQSDAFAQLIEELGFWNKGRNTVTKSIKDLKTKLGEIQHKYPEAVQRPIKTFLDIQTPAIYLTAKQAAALYKAYLSATDTYGNNIFHVIALLASKHHSSEVQNACTFLIDAYFDAIGDSVYENDFPLYAQNSSGKTPYLLAKGNVGTHAELILTGWKYGNPDGCIHGESY